MSAVPRTAPLAFWAIAQSFLNTLFALFGAPEAVAFQHTHTSQQRALLLPWLRAREALMRRLLLLEASAYPKPNTHPLLTRTRAKRARRIVGFDENKPEAWRVSFRCFQSPPAARALRKRPHARTSPSDRFATAFPASGGAIGAIKFYEGKWFTAKPTKFTSAWPLVERYEALIRIFNNPAPFAKRLAARLHATRHRAVELMRLPARCRAQPPHEATVYDLIPDFAVLDAAAHAACNSS